MTEKEKKVLADQIKRLKEDNLKLTDEIANLKKTAKNNKNEPKTKGKTNKQIFKEFVGEAKDRSDIVGKSFLVKKEAKVGTNLWGQEVFTEGGNRKNVLNTLENTFGTTDVQNNSINHTYKEGRQMLFTLEGVPVEECALAPDGEYNYDKATFTLGKYALKTPTSIEFVEFVENGAKIAEKLVLDLRNLIAKHSLNADDTANGKYGLFNTSGNRSLTAVELGTPGIITADEILDLRHVPEKGILSTGTYLFSESALRQIELIKNGDDNYIFATGNGGLTFAGFPQVGVIANRPVIAIPDDVWFKVGFAIDTLEAVVGAYVDGDAFEYYKKRIENYKELVNTIDSGENIDDYVVVEVKQSDNAGCVELVAMQFEGFGVTDPTAGVLLINPAVVRNGKGIKALTKEQIKEQMQKKKSSKKRKVVKKEEEK